MLTRTSTLPKGLPKKVTSLCPECGKPIPGVLRDSGGKVVMEKSCKEHGSFSDVVWSDTEMYLRAESWAKDGVGVENPAIREAKNCPFDCGLCNLHLSHTALANVDLTNRCNLRCPICFANANAAGYVFEPDYETVSKMLQMLRDERPVPTPAVQFSGGEPTIHPDFVRIIKKASDLKFAQVQVATNGIRFANEPEFLKASRDAGLNTIYLQFDGLKEENYIAARGRPLLEIKKKAVENVKKLEGRRPSIVLVPTVVKGVTDDQVWPIVEYAMQNSEVIRGINFQPVAFSGRISQKEREKQRYTISDLVLEIEEKSKGAIARTDWYPPPAVAVISDLAGIIMKKNYVTFTTHPGCGLATYLFIDKKTGGITPLPRFVNVDRVFEELNELVKKAKERRGTLRTKLDLVRIFWRNIDKRKLPKGMSRIKFLRMILAVVNDKTKKGLAKFSWDMLYIGSMHFQDAYNYDIDRVMRCSIHYTTPDGRIIPFCAYNSGPVYRTEIEKKFSVPLDQWRKEKGADGL
ncbi:MAG: radical SAM protein [Thermoplasmata archaeon]